MEWSGVGESAVAVVSGKNVRVWGWQTREEEEDLGGGVRKAW